jgi:uncharacterized membrane protein YhaH (DUF805 family)
MKWYLSVLRNYATFSGRARRKEYWMFVLFNFIFLVCAVAIDLLINFVIAFPYGPFSILYCLFVFIPTLALDFRRLHDTGKSGWFLLMGLIPIVGGIIILVFMVTEGDPFDNKYGPNPKAVESF